ncbi:HelD family protein [Robinsoniella peoriensis]|uniref:Helicase IV n=1 Tax=Robinsoniella peoriensis TaxID=180332 RepID=A0A4V6HRQ0_9FIRM|nr:UvrD-helicase domain-containing protein [Robinsoniella peoriensis]MDU7029141.1 AAA family ATPase [Clostridiales bacterium]TLC99917.1 Helicase IV [Robinsoniella peoriensis]
MVNNQSELEFENKRLEQTISLAEEQLEKARQNNEENKSAIISAKKEMRENTSHSISGLWSSEGFEALAELSQYVNPVLDKIADYEEVENKIFLLENLIKSPYFARIDFKFDDEDTFEKIYIGRSSLKNLTTHELYIYDWRSPIASVFYRFLTGPVFYDAPSGRINGEVNLKRQFEISCGKLEYFFDADVQIVDEFLRQLLSKNTSSKMKTIIETIQKEQDIVIRDMENDLMMVQGVAGSGKTSIALHRAAYLMYQDLQVKLSANNIIIISPNSLFEQYISDVLPELGESNVVSMVFEEIITKLFPNVHLQSRNQFLENLITSPEYRKVIKSSIEFKTSRRFLEMIDRFISDLPQRWIAFEDVYYDNKCIVSKDIMRYKISGRAETPLGMKLKQLETFILESVNAAQKKRLSKAQESLIKEEIKKFTELNISDLYRQLFLDKEYFYSLADDLEHNEYMEEILEFTQENLDSNLLHYDDAAVLAYLHLKIYGTNDYKSIKQVVIDEAQDYYPLQFEIFNLLFPNSKFTILGDMNQTLGKQENLSLYDQISSILNKKKSSLVTMDKSFRCTNEILNYSLKFIEHNPGIKSFNRQGDAPEIHAASDPSALSGMILKEVNTCMEKGYRSIGLICKSERNALRLFDSLKDKIDLQLIKNESVADLHGVFIIPVYMSKGLEFDAVLICDTDALNYNNKDDKNLLYIACTRALHRLNLFCPGDMSPLL